MKDLDFVKKITLMLLVQSCIWNLSVCADSKNDQGLPVVYIHGFGSSCEEDMKGSAFKAMRDESPYKNPLYCIEYGYMVNSVLRSMTYLTQKACKEFERYETKYNLKNGFIIYGSSQGAMIGRYIIEECSVG